MAATEQLVEVVDAAASPWSAPSARRLWGGEWLGHPLHPMLTDLPIGFWTSGVMLDVLGPRRYARAARALIGLGVLCVPPTAIAGLSDYSTIDDDEARRTGALHATLNVTATTLFAMSWWRRRHGGGRLLGVAGSIAASAAGYLGGRLAFPSGSGDGEADGGET